jgi:Calcineurin-like phosphoesterase
LLSFLAPYPSLFTHHSAGHQSLVLSKIRFGSDTSNVSQQSSADDVFQRSNDLPFIVDNKTTPTPPIPPLAKTDALKRFAVIGDFGVGHQPQYLESNGTSGEDAVIQQMMKTFEKKPFASVLTMGDNAYPEGKDASFDDDIRKPLQQFRDKSVRFYPTLGNHDVRNASLGGNQLKYWGTPRYYQAHIGDVDVFAIDTTLFFPGKIGTYTNTDPARVRQAAARQLTWLDKALSSSTAKYKIVYGHYPIHSLSESAGVDHGMTKQLRDILNPILKRDGVDAYLAGHLHAYERTDINSGEIPDFVSGSGGQLLTPKQMNKLAKASTTPPSKVFIPERQFMLFEDTPSGLSFQTISENGKVLDEGIIRPKPERITSEKNKIALNSK